MSKTIKNILVGFLITILLITVSIVGGYQIAKHKYSKPINISDNFDTLKVEYDTLKIHDTIYKPKPYAVIDTIKIPQIVDTNAIIRDYYKERQYLFTYPFGTVSFNVYNNSLFDYAANFNIISQRVFLKPKQLYGIGGGFGVLIDKPFIELNGSYTNRNNMFFIGVSYPFGIRIGYQYLFYKF